MMQATGGASVAAIAVSVGDAPAIRDAPSFRVRTIAGVQFLD
jgi:hypothetical protein